MTARGRALRGFVAVVAVALPLLSSPPARAADSCSTPAPAAGSDQRIVAGSVAGVEFNVLLPSDYGASTRSYPVLYLLHGAGGDRDAWLSNTDLEQFTAPFTGARGVIVVLPTSGGGGYDADWRDGTWLGETHYLADLIPCIDSRFRTLADRAHRAIAGYSLGGSSTLYLAGRHPDLFGAAGAFSGLPLDLTNPSPINEAFWAGLMEVPLPPFGQPWGLPVIDEVWFHSANPTELAPNFGGVSLFVASGNNVPCDQGDVVHIVTPPGEFFGNLELLSHREDGDFADALTNAGVPHTDDFPACGIHDFAAWQRYLHAFWPQMANAFAQAAPPPPSFSYRRVDPRFTVWGWTFTADPKRAAEWLEIRHASARGVKLTGSGIETVTTAPDFNPGAAVRLTGAREAIASADAAGRITFTVDLGPPHPNQEYSPQAILAGENQSGYMTTTSVTFSTRGRAREDRNRPRRR